MSEAQILVGDCMEQMRTLPDGVARCCVTSPPYFGLRDYGHEGQIGLEPTPEEYVARLVEVFRGVRRVLADHGTLWLNLGDSYAGSWGARGRGEGTNAPRPDLETIYGTDAPNRSVVGLKSKDLIGIPWRVAFALQADGWYLRSDIIWHKPNPMPESVRDRPTKAHEYVFLLSKSPQYFYDAEAIAEPITESSKARLSQPNLANQIGSDRVPGKTNGNMKAVGSETRNARTVWTITTKPFKGAHFAVFPPDLAERCILAGSAPGDTVLDPFGGSGTTGMVAVSRGRNAILCELNPGYAAMARQRVADVHPSLGLEAA